MILALVQEGILRSPDVIEALRKVPREHFLPETLRQYAYDDTPLPTEQGQTISAPHGLHAGRYMVAIMNEALELRPGLIVLEIGAGTGYHAAVIAEQVGPKGHVYTVERVQALVASAQRNLERAGYKERVTLIQGDGSLGRKVGAPYDRILVTAAAPRVPEPLVEQLRPGGILLVPVGGRNFPQELVRLRKGLDGKVKRDSLGGVAFVPLIGDQGFDDRT